MAVLFKGLNRRTNKESLTNGIIQQTNKGKAEADSPQAKGPE
jgi:hypothetical protein